MKSKNKNASNVKRADKPAAAGKFAGLRKKFLFSRKQKMIAIISGVLVLGGAGYAAYAAYTMDEVSAGGCVSHVYRKGSTGSCVRYIQKLNNYVGSTKVSVNGIFGSGTKSAIITDQKKFGLTADGVVGPKTWGILCYAQMGYVDAKGVSHPAWPSSGWRDTARAAGCKYA